MRGVVQWIRASSRPPAKGKTIRAPLLLLQPQLLHLLPLLPLLLPLPLPLPLPLWLPLLVAVEAPWLIQRRRVRVSRDGGVGRAIYSSC